METTEAAVIISLFLVGLAALAFAVYILGHLVAWIIWVVGHLSIPLAYVMEYVARKVSRKYNRKAYPTFREYSRMCKDEISRTVNAVLSIYE